MKKLLLLSSAFLALLFISPTSVTAQDDCDGYRTQTPGGWGAQANGNNPGVYRDAHFDDAFPDGLVIGCSENSLLLSSASAIEEYLPCGGQPAVLTASYDNPDCIGNVLTGHLVAITLSLGFDANDPDFGEPDGYLGDLIINNGTFDGWTISDAVAMANDVLGSCNLDYSASQMVNVISMLNENFLDGDSNQGNLDCGGCENEEPPVVLYCPEDQTLNCDDDSTDDSAIFEDDTDLTIDFNETWNQLDCGIEVIRVWTATDECGNTAECTQTVSFTDETPPVFTSWADDETVECSDDLPEAWAEYEEECGEADLSISEEVITSDCPSQHQLIRTYTATNSCGLSSSVAQTIDVQDTTPPVFNQTPADIEIDCGEEIPEAGLVTATDTCDGDLEVVFNEEILGDGEVGTCTLIDPDPYDDLWSMILFTFMELDEILFTTQSMTLVLGENENGITAHLFGTVVSTDNPNGGFTVELNLINGINWEDWSNQEFPTNYKDDFGLAGDNYLDWTYFIVDENNSYLTGWGDFTGSYLTLSHAPSNMYYGYQMGIAANNQDTNYGNGGWMYYEGTFIDLSQNIETEVSGAGDFAFDQFCCDSQNVVRTWTATDCAGNTVSQSQHIVFVASEGIATEIIPSLQIDVENVYPNPANSRVRFDVISNIETTVNIVLFNSMGQPTGVGANQVAVTSGVNTLELNVRSLTSGIYYLHVRNGEARCSEKIIKN
jgi:hypothetical protein